MQKELLIFGAGGALGRGITDVMASKNYDVIYLLNSKFDEAADENFPFKKIKVKDLSIEKNVFNAFAKIKPGKDKIFFLYSTIGGYAGGKYLWETEIDDLENMIKVNLITSFLIAKYFSLLVKDSAAGSICFTAAYTGLNAENQKSVYGAAKGALIHLVKSLSIEGENINMSANAIAPYIIDTEANRKWGKESDLNKWIKPGEIGELAHSIFQNFNFISGNIIQLKNRFDRLIKIS